MKMDQFVLFGDSLTQQSFSQTQSFAFGAALADAYSRKLDVVNRGLSGYNTLQALRALSLCIPETENARVRFVLIFFGANDARLADSPGGPDQHVKLEDFKGNLRGMIEHPAVQAHEDVKVMLVTTPPIDERKCHKADVEKFPHLGPKQLRRSAANTALYAQVVRDLGKEMGVPVVDVWTAMVSRAGYSRDATSATTTTTPPPLVGSLEAPASETLQSFLHDGLHFTGEGNKILYGELMQVIERTWPEAMPARLAMKLPPWDDAEAWGSDDGETSGSREGNVEVEPGTMKASGTFEAVVSDVRRVE